MLADSWNPSRVLNCNRAPSDCLHTFFQIYMYTCTQKIYTMWEKINTFYVALVLKIRKNVLIQFRGRRGMFQSFIPCLAHLYGSLSLDWRVKFPVILSYPVHLSYLHCKITLCQQLASGENSPVILCLVFRVENICFKLSAIIIFFLHPQFSEKCLWLNLQTES